MQFKQHSPNLDWDRLVFELGLSAHQVAGGAAAPVPVLHETVETRGWQRPGPRPPIRGHEVSLASVEKVARADPGILILNSAHLRMMDDKWLLG